MDVIVCIKQVPETTDIGWDPQTGTLIRDGVDGILNANDKHALEEALLLKERHGGTITALSMGPPQAEDALREALSMGIDKAVLLSDKRFAGADTLATSYTLSRAVKKLGRFDLILCGKESADGMTAQVGPQLAELLNVPQLTSAMEISPAGDSVRVKQKLEDGFRLLETTFPALITVESEINQPRIPAMDSIMEAYREKDVEVWTEGDLGDGKEHLGLEGSPTQSRKVYRHRITRGNVSMIEGGPDEAARELVSILRHKGLM